MKRQTIRKTSGNWSFTLTPRRNDYGEFVIRVRIGGLREPDQDYFTDNWQDAVGTLEQMVKNCKPEGD